MLHELAPLVRMLAEDLSHPPDEPGRGLVAGAGQQVHIGEQLAASEPARGSGFVDESALNISVMMSSDGWLSRQLMYFSMRS